MSGTDQKPKSHAPAEPGLNPGLNLRRLRQARRLTAVGLARALEIPAQRIYDIERGKQKLSLPLALSLKDFFGVNLSDILESPKTPLSQGSEAVWIQGYQAVAGENSPEEKNTFCIPIGHLKKQNLDVSDLVFVRVKGRSMEPVFWDQDLLLINTKARNLSLMKPFLFRLDEETYVKHLQRLPDGAVLVVSENGKNFPPYQIERGIVETPRFEIIGQVVSSVHYW